MSDGLREALPLKMSPFEETGARLRNEQWDAAQEPAASEPGSDADYMARYDRRILLVELDALRAALAASPSAGVDVERLARAMARCAEVGPPAHHTPEQAEEHWKSYRMEAEEYAREYAAIAAAYSQEKP